MKKGLLALSPIAAMILLLIGNSIYYGGVSNAPLLLVFVLTAMVAIAVTRGIRFKERVSVFSRGAGSPNLLLMVWIFMLAGAFAASAKEMGAAEAMVNPTLRILPARFALTGLFLAACLNARNDGLHGLSVIVPQVEPCPDSGCDRRLKSDFLVSLNHFPV